MVQQQAEMKGVTAGYRGESGTELCNGLPVVLKQYKAGGRCSCATLENFGTTETLRALPMSNSRKGYTGY